jgi:hypothetical protein
MKKPKQYSELTLEQWLLAMPPDERKAVIVANTGTSLNYIQKRIWTRDYDVSPKFKLKIAVGLVKAAKGQLDLRDLTDEAEDVDWDFLRRTLTRTIKPVARV